MGNQTTVIPLVPINTPMYDSPGVMNRTWILYFQKLAKLSVPSPLNRTLELWDLSIGTPAAGALTVQSPGSGSRIVATLSKPIGADLTVTFTKGADLMSITVPAATPLDTPVVQSIAGIVFLDDEVIIPAITASDGSISTDRISIVTFSLEWT